MKYLGLIAIIVAGFLWVAQTHVTFSPFKVKLDHPLKAVGFLFLGVGLILIQTACYNEGRKTMLNEVNQIMDEELQKLESTRQTEL